jgi:hypothetical protein
MLDPQLTAKNPLIEFYKNPINGSVADTTSQADGHGFYERSSFSLLKQHQKNQQNMTSINYNAVKNWLLILTNSFPFILVLLMITQRFVNFAISRNLLLVATAIVNKLMTSNLVHVSVNLNSYPYGKKLSDSMQLADLSIMRIEKILVTYNNLNSNVM